MIKLIVSLILALIYSAFVTILGPMIHSQDIRFESSMILPFILCFAIGAVLNFILLSLKQRGIFEERKGRLSAYFDKIGDRRLFFIVWILIFLSWIPAYLILFPGVLSYDCISQVHDAFGTIKVNHHPVLHTWLLRVFMGIGNSVFGQYEAGIGILSLVQMILLSYALSRLILLLKKHRVPGIFILFTIILSALWFQNSVLAVTMVKDTGHAAFLVLFVCHFTEIVLDPSEYKKRKANLFLFPLVSFLMCALRNNGLHIYLFCFAILFITRIVKIRKAKEYAPLIAVIVLPVVLFKIYTGPVFSALNILPGQVREALCVPIQQLQRVAMFHFDELSSEDRDRMDYYIDNLEWLEWDPGRKYDPFNSDPAKSCFYSDNYNEDPVAFWKYWGRLGTRFSKEYAVAFLSNSLGYWYPGFYYYSFAEFENYPPEEFDVPLERKSFWSSGIVPDTLKSLCTGEIWRKIPVVRVFFVPAYAAWILLYVLILSWKKKGWFTDTLPVLLPLIAQIGIMFLCPIPSFRYSWPFFLILPVAMIGLKKNETDK